MNLPAGANLASKSAASSRSLPDLAPIEWAARSPSDLCWSPYNLQRGFARLALVGTLAARCSGLARNPGYRDPGDDPVRLDRAPPVVSYHALAYDRAAQQEWGLLMGGSEDALPPQPVAPTTGTSPPPLDPGGPPELGEWVFTAVAPMAALYGKALLEALGERSATGLTALPGKLRQRWFRRGVRSVEAVLDLEDRPSAAILVTDDLPDEARLALLDLDLAEPSLQGEVLTWEVESRQWVPAKLPSHQVRGPRTHM
ncbi:hypothetical protein AB0M45_00755 [Nocardia sp. NPDC051787]|uniref:hypothetical protein n=1 Tax=Nocardia sp. NPDC051787 TaxID=3155415 RepID=UPI00343119B8